MLCLYVSQGSEACKSLMSVSYAATRESAMPAFPWIVETGASCGQS